MSERTWDWERAVALIEKWRPVLGLGSWTIFLSPIPPTDSEQIGSSDHDTNVTESVLRFDPTLPNALLERTVVHELLHVRLVALEDAFNQVVGDDATARAWWHRAKETAIEALVDALVPEIPRQNHRGGPEWVTAAEIGG